MPQVAVAQTGVQLLSRNAYRESLVFYNPSANVLFADRMNPRSITTGNAGVRIPAGGIYALSAQKDGKDAVVDEWSGVTDAGSNTIFVDEYVIRKKRIPPADSEVAS